MATYNIEDWAAPVDVKVYLRLINQKRQDKIIVPKDIYDALFDDLLQTRWKEERRHGDHYAAEHIGRVIEFLEKHLRREEDG